MNKINAIEKVKNSKILNNDVFMSSIGLAFIFSFITGLFKIHTIELFQGTKPLSEVVIELTDNFNSCLYPSALALIIMESLHNNKKMTTSLFFYTFLTAWVYIPLNLRCVAEMIRKLLVIEPETFSLIFGLSFTFLGVILIFRLYNTLYKGGGNAHE